MAQIDLPCAVRPPTNLTEQTLGWAERRRLVWGFCYIYLKGRVIATGRGKVLTSVGRRNKVHAVDAPFLFIFYLCPAAGKEVPTRRTFRNLLLYTRCAWNVTPGHHALDDLTRPIPAATAGRCTQ